MKELKVGEARQLARELLAGFTYKQGWQFGERDLSIRLDIAGHAWPFWMTMTQPDTDDLVIEHPNRIIVGTDGLIDLGIMSYGPDPRFEFFRQLTDEIHRFERHETFEWARFRGEKIINPHYRGVAQSHIAPANYALEPYRG